LDLSRREVGEEGDEGEKVYAFGSNYDYEGSPLNEFKNATQVRKFFEREERRNSTGSSGSKNANKKSLGKGEKQQGGKQLGGKQQGHGGKQLGGKQQPGSGNNNIKGAKKKKLGGPGSSSSFQTMNPMNAGAILSPIKGFPLYADGHGGEHAQAGVGNSIYCTAY
jgi:hypothetical protein